MPCCTTQPEKLNCQGHRLPPPNLCAVSLSRSSPSAALASLPRPRLPPPNHCVMLTKPSPSFTLRQPAKAIAPHHPLHAPKMTAMCTWCALLVPPTCFHQAVFQGNRRRHWFQAQASARQFCERLVWHLQVWAKVRESMYPELATVSLINVRPVMTKLAAHLQLPANASASAKKPKMFRTTKIAPCGAAVLLQLCQKAKRSCSRVRAGWHIK